MTLAEIAESVASEGLVVSGAFHPAPEDGAPEDTATLVLLGPAIPAMWECFAAGPEYSDGAPNPLDRWSRRVIGALAERLGATAQFPFGGPPYAPFLRWARRGEGARPSPVGMLVSQSRGLWMSYRGALAFRETLTLPPVRHANPCLGCPAPCLAACPVGALGGGTAYDIPACTAHVAGPDGNRCRETGCLVRHACPAGADAALPEAQSRFHMTAFLSAHTAS